MSSTNSDTVKGGTGQFKPSRPLEHPPRETHHTHQPGRLVSEKDNAPEYHAQTLPPGSAPPNATYQPNPTPEVPSQADNSATLSSEDKVSTYTSAEATLGGATSQDVHKGLGHPGQGQTSSEIRHDGQHRRKGDGAGIEGLGSAGNRGIDDPAYNPRDDDDHREGLLPGKTHNAVLPGAEEREPERAA